jgi:hypothetical protein
MCTSVLALKWAVFMAWHLLNMMFRTPKLSAMDWTWLFMESEIECDAMANELIAISDHIKCVVGSIWMCVIFYMRWVLIRFINL